MRNKVLILVLFLMAISAPSLSAQTVCIPFTRAGANILIDVTVGGKTRHFLLDTGAGLTVLAPDTVGWSPVDVRKAVSSRSAVGIDGATRSMGSTTATIELGKTLIVMPVGVANLRPLSKVLNARLDGILGQDVLSHFSLTTIDNKNQYLILKK
jgi:predicted aspartyl protease